MNGDVVMEAIDYYEVYYPVHAYEDGETDYDSTVGYFATEEAARVVQQFCKKRWDILDHQIRRVTIHVYVEPKQFLLDKFKIAYEDVV